MHDELIARLEAATADQQRELLFEAWGALRPEPPIWGTENWGEWWSRKRRFRAMLKAEAYESAALTLVPDGMRRRTIVYEDGRAGVQVWWPTEPLPDVWGKAYASEPIATVIAALRAKGDA